MRRLNGLLAAAAMLGLVAGQGQAAKPREPIIDVHVHALAADEQGPPPLAMCTPIAEMPTWDMTRPVFENFLEPFKKPACKDPVWSPTTDEEVMRRTFAVMERHNVFGVVSGRYVLVSAWQKAMPMRVIPSLMPELPLSPNLEKELGDAKAGGQLAVIGELGFQYDGISVSDPALAPLWSAAEKLDLPVAIHFGPGPPGVAYMPGSGYRARLSSPLALEDVLVKHPKLRVNVMHAGYPMLDDTLALLYAHPQVYLDTGVIVYTQPRAEFYRYLKAIVDAGFGKRIMFGSDQMVWPETMERAIQVIQQAPFLTSAQKRDILYNNAARFLRLDEETRRRHRGG